MKPKQNGYRPRIFLADLTYDTTHVASGFMPLAIGMVASYVIEQFGSDVEIRLFKYPDKLLQALQEEHCDVLACSAYCWNHKLALWACRVAKKNNPKTLTCLGGPDFPEIYDQKLQYLEKHDYVDVRVIKEGEIAFANVIARMLDVGNSDIFTETIDGCVFLHPHEKTLIEGTLTRVVRLDSIPSPYVTGLLDEFFDGQLVPIIQTTRGCPFTCNFCTEADSYFNKINSFETQYAVEELHYIGEHISKTPITMLQIADSNYGMYKRDKVISETIKEIQEKYRWPLGIYASTGKNFKNVIDNTEILGDTIDFSMSVQSMDEIVLEEIGRNNLSPDKYKWASETLASKGQPTLAETIVPLPKETLDSYLNGILDLIDWGAKRVISNTLMVINGTIYKDQDYMNKFGYVTKYRLLPGLFGVYGGEQVIDYEEVGVATDSLSFDDYLETRKFTFLVEVLFNSSILLEAELLVKDYELLYKDFVMLVYRELDHAHDKIQQVFQSLVNESKEELKDDEKSLEAFYQSDVNYEKLLNGEIGGNLKYNHKALILSSCLSEWLEFVFDCLRKFVVLEKNIDAGEEISALKQFVRYKLDGVLDSTRTDVDINDGLGYDFVRWLDQDLHILPLSAFKTEDSTHYRFYFSPDQVKERNYLFSLHGENGSMGLAHIMGAIKPQQRLFRKFELSNGV